MIARLRLVMLTVMACSNFVKAENLYKGGDFEKDHVKWTLPTNGFWSFKDGEGRGGSRALVLEQPTNAPFMWPTMDSIRVIPATTYRFYMWVKKDSYDAPRGRLYVSFKWSDVNGKSIDGCEGFATEDNAVDGWVCYEAKTAPMPRNAFWGSFSIWMSQGVNGRLRFDDFSIEQLPSNPTVVKVVTSAYQDRIDRGPVKVVAEYVVNPDLYPDDGLTGVLEYPLASGGRVASKVTVKDGFAVGGFDAEALSVGTNSIAVALFSNGKEIARNEVSFERTGKPPVRKVMFDAMHRTVVDGKRFFPLGMYWLRVTKKDIVKYKEAPFNCLMPYQGSGKDMLDLCHREGLKVLYTMKSGWKNAADPVKEEAYIMRALRFKDHPAVLAWYICDELPSSLAPLLVKRHRRIREVDPEHPTWIVLDKPKHTRFFMGGFDVIANDPYPLGYHGAGLEGRLHKVSEHPRFIDEQLFATRPLWQVPQVFDWGDYFPAEIGLPNVRRPNLDEMRSMTWQAVAAGVNGLIYYSYFDIWKKRHGAAKSEAHWNDVVVLAKEVKKMERVLLSDDRTFELAGADSRNVVWRCYSCDGDDWLLIANRNVSSYKAELSLPDRYSEVDVSLGRGVSLAKGGEALKIDFAAFDYAFVRLKKQ